MLTLNILSLNVNGLNSAVKRTRVLEYLHRKSISCALIQASHLKQSDVACFQNKYYKLAAFSWCYCNSTPLWHNLNFVCGNRPFVHLSCSSLGVNTCSDIYDNQGLCSFQTLRTKFCLPASAYFVFLQLRAALKAYGVPWTFPISSHPMRDWIAPSAGRPSVSLIYNKIIDCITKPLSIKTIWNRELSDLNLSVDWERVWSNLSLTSKNLAHRLIHFKVIHRAYTTPYKRFKMKLQPNFNCHICNTASSGTLLHMFWECPIVINLWTHVNLVLSSLLQIDCLLTQVCVFLMMILVSV